MVKTTIQIDGETKHRLDQFGKKNETYDELINRLLDRLQSQPGTNVSGFGS